MLTIAHYTNGGKIRRRNEDALLIHDRVVQLHAMLEPEFTSFSEFPIILGIADGMGGAPAGDLAANMVLTAFSGTPRLLDSREVAFSAGENILRILHEWVLDEPELEGIGAAATLLVIQQDKFVYFHAGDTRFYHIKRDIFRKKDKYVVLTRDHTVANELLRYKKKTKEEIESLRLRDTLTSAFSGWKELFSVDWEYRALPVSAGRFLLATDGLWAAMEKMEGIHLSGVSLQEAARSLAEKIEASNPRDNFSFLMFDL